MSSGEELSSRLLILAYYLSTTAIGAGVVVSAEMIGPISLWQILTIAALVVWAVGFAAMKASLMFVKWRAPGTVVVPRKERELLFSALWPVTIWWVKFDQTPLSDTVHS